MYSNKKKLEYRYSVVILPILLTMLVFGLFTFLIDSFNVVSETNKNNFFYTTKIRNSINEIDKIVERAEINLDGASFVISQTYDISKLNDAKYNKLYLNHIDVLIKAILANTPEIDGSWFQLSIESPIHLNSYLWYQIHENKIINLRRIFEEQKKGNPVEREINPKDDPYYFEAVEHKKTTWSDIYKDADIGKEMITISKPIYVNDKLVGVLGVDITTQNFKQALTNMKAEFPSSEIYLLDTNKEILLNIKQDGTSKINDALFFKNKFTALGKTEDMTEYRENWVDKTAIKLPLSNKYSIVISFPNAIIYKGFSRLFKTLYFVFAVLLLLLATILLNSDRIKKMNNKIKDEARKLRTILDSSPNRITMADADGSMVYANIQFLNAFNLKIEDIRGKKFDFIFRPEIVPNIYDGLKLAKETMQVQTFESSYSDPNEGELYFTNYIIPLSDSKGSLTGYVGLAMDVTKEVKEKELLKQAKAVAEKTTAMKSNFLANMSHEIRTPLNGILGFLQLLSDTSLTKEQEEFVQDAQKSSEILLELINDILDFSKIEADKLKIDNICFDIRSSVEDVILTLAPSANNKNLEINLLVSSEVPQRVYGDPGRIKQIINNLVGNAIKFTQSGEINVEVKLLEEKDDIAELCFEIKDSGIGIEKSKLEMIFDAFTQADASMTRKFGGTGLGLAISQKLVQLMDGEMLVKSEPGKGSLFAFKLKLCIDRSFNKDLYLAENDLDGKKIIILSSNATDTKILDHYLNEFNGKVLTTSSMEELVSILDNNKDISAILVDYLLDGNRELQNLQQLPPAVLLTPLGKKINSDFCSNKKYCTHLNKPVRKTELIKTLLMLIKNKTEEFTKPQITKKELINDFEFKHRAKILVVEDCEINSKLIIKILSNQGITADSADDGIKAVDAFKKNKYDVVLMDCQMPNMNGYEATKEIRKYEQETNVKSPVPIIAITANAFESDKLKCFESGMTDYVTKPLKIQELLDKISHYALIRVDKTTEKAEISNILEQLMTDIGFTKEEAMNMYVEYFNYLPTAISELSKAIENEDYKAIQALAHKMKGSSANLRIESIKNICILIEEFSIRGDSESCLAWTKSLECEIDYFKTLLQNFV